LSTHYTPHPSTALPGQVVGAGIRLPAVLCCTSGEIFCGKTWVANTHRQFVEKAAEKRRHEEACGGGLIVVRA
jgi:hypothetical protein